jgi:hypothetical protein
VELLQFSVILEKYEVTRLDIFNWWQCLMFFLMLSEF